MASSLANIIVPALNSIQITRNGVVAVYSLSIYEWLDTLPTEIELIYRSRWNSIKVAYLLCRYYQLLVWPLVIFAYGNSLRSTRPNLIHTKIVTILLLPMVCSNYLPQLAFYAALVGTDIWFFCFNVVPLPDSMYEALGGTGCFPDYAANGGSTRMLIAMSASSVMDLVSLSIIALYCLRTRSTRGSLGRIFISQGLGAFAVVLAVHGVALGTYFSPTGFHNGVGLPYILVISNLMACRLILDLRRKALPTETEILRRHSHLVDKAFQNTDLWMIGEEQHPQYPMESFEHRSRT
ncbi:hypothetical protein DFH06DRAFT_1136806 [Mycena polygramma]|nr:hypothetical protein DFH06DRAFT_1136806 [Mycena polygramma]